MNPKKLFIAVLVLLILAGGTLFFYNFYFKKWAEPSQDQGNQTPKEYSFKPKPITQEAIFAPAIDEDGRTIKYYTAQNGHVFKVSFDGSSLEPVYLTDLPDLVKITWSPDKTKVIGIFDSQNTIKKNVYDFNTKTVSWLNENIKWIDWSPDSQRIVYQFQTGDKQKNSISIANPDGSQWRDIFQTRLENLVVEWPVPDKISLRNVPSGTSPGSLFVIDPDSGSLNKILTDFYGLSVKWSPDGQQILFQSTDEKGKNLKSLVAPASGSQPRELPLTTIAEKCVWSADSINIFCAVPQIISANAVWPDDYFSGRLIIKDDFYIINSATLEKTKIASSDDIQSFDAQNLVLSPQEDYLFFINRLDGFLYSIGIKETAIQ